MYSVTQIGVQARQTYGDKPSARHTIVMCMYYMLPSRFTKEQAVEVIELVKKNQPDLARLHTSYYWMQLNNKQYIMEVS